MNDFLIGAGAALGSAVVSAIVYIYFRLRTLEAALLKSRQEVKDAKIADKVHALSDAERDALLAKQLVRTDAVTKS